MKKENGASPEWAGIHAVIIMEIQNSFFLLLWPVAFLVGLIPLFWFLKQLYGYFRLVWLVLCLASSSPIVLLEIMQRDFDALKERVVPLLDTIESDMVYSTLDWFSQPFDRILRLAQNRWYLLKHRGVYQRWRRRKDYHRHRERPLSRRRLRSFFVKWAINCSAGWEETVGSDDRHIFYW